MIHDGDSQQALLKEQQERDRQMKIIDRLHDLTVHGAKGLGVLNAGAAVAMFAFVQALVDKPAYLAFKPYVLGALSSFILGAFLERVRLGRDREASHDLNRLLDKPGDVAVNLVMEISR
ncbi:MAG: hypothetical protein PHI11_12105 [Gallionella sp.]|nr:hypothetical protein [Gallionella sp.]